MRHGVLALGLLLPACFSKPPAPQAVGDSGVDVPSDVPPGTIRYVGPFVQLDTTMATFNAAAVHVGDAIVVHITCVSGLQTTISLNGGPWAFTELGPHADGGCCSTTSFGGIASTTVLSAFQIQTAPGCAELVILGDEFTGNDPSGATATFDNQVSSAGAAAGLGLIAPHANDAVWGAVTNGGTATIGTGFSPGASVQGNVAEYLLPGHPANSNESVAFNVPATDIEITAITIKPM